MKASSPKQTDRPIGTKKAAEPDSKFGTVTIQSKNKDKSMNSNFKKSKTLTQIIGKKRNDPH